MVGRVRTSLEHVVLDRIAEVKDDVFVNFKGAPGMKWKVCAEINGH